MNSIMPTPKRTEVMEDKFRLVNTEKQFSCKICEKGFTQQWILDRHNALIHDKVSYPFSCGNCEKQFTQQMNLKSHKSSLHEEVDFLLSCDKCEKKFTQQWNLDRHYARHNASNHEEDYPFSCNKCERQFKQQWNFDRHTEYMHERVAYPFSCDKCGKRFLQQWNYDRHIERSHGNMSSNVHEQAVDSTLNADLNIKENTDENSNNNSDIENALKYLLETSFQDNQYEIISIGNLIGLQDKENLDILNIPIDHYSEMPVSNIIDESSEGIAKKNSKSTVETDSQNITKKNNLKERRKYKCDHCNKMYVSKATLKSHVCKGSKLSKNKENYVPVETEEQYQSNMESETQNETPVENKLDSCNLEDIGGFTSSSSPTKRQKINQEISFSKSDFVKKSISNQNYITLDKKLESLSEDVAGKVSNDIFEIIGNKEESKYSCPINNCNFITSEEHVLSRRAGLHLTFKHGEKITEVQDLLLKFNKL